MAPPQPRMYRGVVRNRVTLQCKLDVELDRNSIAIEVLYSCGAKRDDKELDLAEAPKGKRFKSGEGL